MADIQPPWGAFPVEQYLIHNWNPAAAEAPEPQRRALIDAFLAAKSIPKEWDNVAETKVDFQAPTSQEIEQILLPWRSQRLRELAAGIWTAERYTNPVLLRTHYDGSEDADQKFRKWMKSDNGFESDESIGKEDQLDDSYVLNDSSYFNFGNDWRHVFYILPELAGPFATEDRQRTMLSKHSAKRNDVEEQRRRLRENLAKTPTPAEIYITYDEGATELQTFAIDSWLIIADTEAFEKDSPLLVFLDSRGNVIRQTRVEPDHRGHLGEDLWVIWRVEEANFFTGYEPIGETNLSQKYLLNGEIGRELYGLEDEEVESFIYLGKSEDSEDLQIVPSSAAE